MTKALDIRDLDVVQLTDALKAMGEPGFRAKQIHQWLWQKGARSFEEMTNLSKPLREKLTEAFTFHVAKVHTAQHSKDGTIKVAFELHDGNKVEGVLIPTSSRTTACVSSQVGCSLDCKFCATGYLKRMRNLSAAEIFDQVWLINELALEHHGKRLDNIVYMGMGEPLLNYANVLQSIQIITSPEGLGMSPQRLTVSTAGIAKMIHKLADDGIKTNLALSCMPPTTTNALPSCPSMKVITSKCSQKRWDIGMKKPGFVPHLNTRSLQGLTTAKRKNENSLFSPRNSLRKSTSSSTTLFPLPIISPRVGWRLSPQV